MQPIHVLINIQIAYIGLNTIIIINNNNNNNKSFYSFLEKKKKRGSPPGVLTPLHDKINNTNNMKVNCTS